MSTRLAQLLTFREARPEDPFVHYAVALERKGAGELEEARKDFIDVLARFPSYVPAYFHYGQLLEELGDSQEARTVYLRGIECAQRAGDSHAAKELRGALELLG